MALGGAAGGENKLAAAVAPVNPAELRYRDQFLRLLAKDVPRLLRTYDARTGRFGAGIWTCQDQEQMFPLAVVYATPGKGNTHFKDAKLLDVITKAGDALIDDMDEHGQWEFRKKDGSTWGKISMPWTYSRWIRSYALIREDMAPARRARWIEAFDRGFSHIERTQLGRPHNIPTHLAMALYMAGKEMDRPAWRERATQFLHKVCQAQMEGGYWTEGEGPLVNYNFVYLDALGAYFTASNDREVLPALERGIRFHIHFTYPSGEAVETIDLRNPYAPRVLVGNPAFTLTPEGRGWLRKQWSRLGDRLGEDTRAMFVLHGKEGPVSVSPAKPAAGWYILSEKSVERAATLRQGLWFICLSAFTAGIERNRWHQDRQNLVSIWHEKVGLILGGGNTKLQPAWSNFTVGDMTLLQHRPGDTNPDFLPRGPLYHVPSAARLLRDPQPGLDLTYGPENCRLMVRIVDDRTLEYQIEASAQSGLQVLGHLTLLPTLGAKLRAGRSQALTLGASALTLAAEQLDGRLEYNGCRFRLPAQATLHWPALPHDPYRKDGRASPSQGRIEIRVPLQHQRPCSVTLEVVS
jgi:hypothetical protein